jgi:hypothetical protein
MKMKKSLRWDWLWEEVGEDLVVTVGEGLVVTVGAGLEGGVWEVVGGHRMLYQKTQRHRL